MGHFWAELGKLIVSKDHRERFKHTKEWEHRLFDAPSPPHIKRTVLLRNSRPDSIWVETGTFQGVTTAILAASAAFVHSIEPEPALYRNAARRFASSSNVRIHHGLSEKILPELLPMLSGNLCFWLDGHFSGGITHKGPIDTPVLHELAAIEQNMQRFSDLTVLIDDVRCFDPRIPEYSAYPELDVLVDWARRNSLQWNIEQDIFLARRA